LIHVFSSCAVGSFRNNHFNTLFKFEGGVYLLVTDQGYECESDIVWERLDSVNGDTTLCSSSFGPFVPHAEPGGGAAGTPGGGGGGMLLLQLLLVLLFVLMCCSCCCCCWLGWGSCSMLLRWLVVTAGCSAGVGGSCCCGGCDGHNGLLCCWRRWSCAGGGGGGGAGIIRWMAGQCRTVITNASRAVVLVGP
jgi:hypothetical protein